VLHHSKLNDDLHTEQMVMRLKHLLMHGAILMRASL
jgi:hypothetical protein